MASASKVWWACRALLMVGLARGDVGGAETSINDHADITGSLVIPVEHSFDDGRTFSLRGTMTVDSLKSGSVSFAQSPLTEEQLSALQSLCSGRGVYLVRLKSSKTEEYHRTFADACFLLQSQLQDVFTFHLDWRNQIIGVSVAPKLQKDLAKAGRRAQTFKTEVIVQQMEPGPQPDTAAFVQKLEQEKLAKQRGETPDNRSFFAKYWMYIVPFVIILAMNSGGQDAQGGGGGGR